MTEQKSNQNGRGALRKRERMVYCVRSRGVYTEERSRTSFATPSELREVRATDLQKPLTFKFLA